AREEAGSLVCSLNFRRSLFDDATAVRLLERFERLLSAAVSAPESRVGALPLLPAAERFQLLAAWNDTRDAAARRDACLHELILAQAERTPEAPAVRCGEEVLTYAGLERRSGRLARRLAGLGVGPEVRVGLFLEQSLEGIVGLLGILRAGGAYVPLDPAAPAERLASIVEDSGLTLVVSRGGAPPVPVPRVVSLDDDPLEEGGAAAAPASPSNLAYVLYTSGSTGRPKGVMVEHRSVVNYALAIVRKLGLRPGESFAQVQPLTVDSCVTAIFPPLLSGGSVHVVPRELALDAQALSEVLGRHRPDGLKIAPSHLSALRAAAPDGALLPRRWLVVGGEASQLAWLRGLRSEAPGCAVFNHYGPTEATVGMLMYEVDGRPGPGFSESAPVGRPLANCQAYLLDTGLEPAPLGALGTLHIGGDCVARGYLGRPDLTAERFIPDPHGAAPGGRLYDSGDLMRQTAEGDLVFAGRLDHQVKIRGLRIELGEVEAAVARHPGVREVVVRVWEEGPGRQGLAAYVVPRQPGVAPPPDTRELRRFLADKLPDAMTPSAVVPLAELPRTPHGKLDLKALPAVEPAREAEDAGGSLPRGAVEELLAGIWAGVLGRDRVAVGDDFFAVGGHSLLATQVVARVRSAFGVDLALRELFEAPTLEGFAARVEQALRSGAGLAAPPIVPVPRDRDLPLSFAQQRLWFLDQLDPGNPLYNIGIALRVRGPLDVRALVRSLEEIVRRHEVLRTVFRDPRDRSGAPAQVVMPPAPLELPRVDLSALDPARRAEAPLQLAAEQARRPFDLARGPLFRVLLARLGEGEHAVLFTLHHIVSDGWSMRNLVAELGALYPAFAAGEPSPLPALAVQYADFADWQRRWLDGEVLDAELAHWRERLAGSPPFLELPADRPRPLAQRFRGGLVPLAFPAHRELRAFARREGATLFMLILAGLQTLLSRYTGQKDLCVGTPIAGRNRRETEDLIGFFVNTLVLRADLSGGPAFRALLRQVRETALQAHAHQDLPFEKLLEHLAPPRNLSYSPLFQVMLDLHNLPRRRLELEGLVLEALEVDTATAKFDLTLTLSDREDGLSGVLEYDRDLFDGTTVARLGEHLNVLLEGALADPGLALADLPLLARSERWQALYEWNDTQRDYPRACCIQDLFERQASRTPDAVAVSFEGRTLSYRQLDARANRLAHWLLARGAAVDGLVAVLLERSLEMIVALVGILKAGGAYAPLEPGMPPARLRFLLDDVASPALLTQGALLPEIEAAGGFDGPVLLLDAAGLEGLSEASPGLPSHPDQLAYVNYTSGSTGRPKGVVVPHLGVTRLVRNTDYMEMGPEDVILQLSTYAWDAATWEIWGALLNGGRLVMIPRATVLDFRRLARVLVEERITALYLTTSLFNQFVEQEGGSLAGLGTLIIGGETASVPHFRRAVEMLPGTRIINEYGPTENTSYSSWQLVRETPEQGALPIGKPLANSTVYVLDRDFQPMPVGVPGELLLGGDGLARGYLGRPDLTAERFVPHPFAAGERLYRTGDLGAWRPDGTLDFLGRMDFQVKIRGHRIEPAEVEDAVKRHHRVEDAVVVAYEPIPQDRRLVAYVVPRAAAEGGLEIRELRTFLLETLPDYMVPSAFVLLPALPLSSTGKVDRRALPPPDGAQAAPAGYVAPRNAVEEVVAGMFQELLGVDRIGAEGSFFELGGHSLLATRLVAWVQDTFGLELPLRAVFETPTVEEVAAALLAAPETRHAVERTAELLLELSAAPEDDGPALPGSAS
ncbi:MAG: amino acid adenylation domain-containing protein, partial [Acidobacteriota bacterium]